LNKQQRRAVDFAGRFLAFIVAMAQFIRAPNTERRKADLTS
jgi:hypothetical protein